MPRSVLHRLTICASTVAATAVATVLLAPSAHAGPVGPKLPSHLGSTQSVAPGVLAGVPPFGRKLV